MGRALAAVLLLVALAACSRQASRDGQPYAPGLVRRDEWVTVRGRAFDVEPWCGGAVGEAKERPMTTPLFVHHGWRFEGRPAFARVQPDPDGGFAVSLPPGQYCVVSSTHAAPTDPVDPAADAACMREVRSQCDAYWVVSATCAMGAHGGPVDVRKHAECGWSRACFPRPPSGPP